MFAKKISYASFLLTLLVLAGCSSLQPAPVKTFHHKSKKVAAAATAEPNPTAAQYNVELGMGYLQQGDNERAKRKLLLAMQQDNKSATVLDAMGYFAENTGDNVSAEKYYRQALALNGKAGQTNNNYGAFLCHNKRYKEADQYFQIAVQDPAYLKTAEAYENAGNCAMQVPDEAKASGYFQKAVQQDPGRIASWLQLGQISFNQKNYAQAQLYLDKYLQLESDPSAAALWLGIRLAEQKHDSETAGRYRLMLQAHYPKSPEMKLMLAAQKAQKSAEETNSSVFSPRKIDQLTY